MEDSLKSLSSLHSWHEDAGRGAVVYQEKGSEYQSKNRSYYLDWMRILSIYLVVAFHCVQALDWVHLWEAPQNKLVHLFRAGALQIGMPLFFHISGRAQALGKHNSMCSIILQRVIRLLFPFIVCYFLLIPSWTYIHAASESGFSDNLIQFELRYFNPTYFFEHFDPAWLWFLPVLFVVTVFCVPLIQFTEVGGKGNFAIAFLLWLAIAFGCVQFLGFSMVFALLLLLIPAVPGVTSYLVPFPERLEKQTEYASLQTPKAASFGTAIRQWLAIRASTCLYVWTSVGLVCNMRYTDLSLAGQFIPGVALYIIFYIQGYFTVRWSSNIQEIFDSSCSTPDAWVLCLRSYVRIYELVTVFGLLLVLVTSSPVGEDEHHRMWETALKDSPFFPIYSASRFNDPVFAALHVLGTWSWLALMVALAQAYVDDELHSTLYKHAGSSTMIVYIFHWMFIKPYAFYVVQGHSLKGAFWNLLHLPLTFGVGVGGSLAVYAVCSNVKCLGRLFGL